MMKDAFSPRQTEEISARIQIDTEEISARIQIDTE